MKIAVISTYLASCPPLAYGGESFFWGIAKTLGEQGHEVHLFAPGGSETPPNGYLHLIPSLKAIDFALEEEMEIRYHDIFMEMDIIHDCSCDHIAAERLQFLHGKKNLINTINGSTYPPYFNRFVPRSPFNVVTGSKIWQKTAKEAGMNSEMVYWGIDTDFYTPGGDKGDYFLWLARFHPTKGLDLALDLAEILGFPLKVAGSTYFADHAAYAQEYMKRIDKIPNVEYVELPMDSTHHTAKRELYRGARALIYPVNYFECFGMVVVEAMACGTPVLALPNGAMPEIIIDGETGFLCNTKHDFTKAIMETIPDYEKKVNYHNGFNFSKNCRQQALNFTWGKSTEGYLKLYDKVMKGGSW
jgi:glycosyltransferase involved in cell wall biosynthesis